MVAPTAAHSGRFTLMITHFGHDTLNGITTVYAFYADGSELSVELDDCADEWLQRDLTRKGGNEGVALQRALHSACWRMGVEV